MVSHQGESQTRAVGDTEQVPLLVAEGFPEALQVRGCSRARIGDGIPPLPSEVLQALACNSNIVGDVVGRRQVLCHDSNDLDSQSLRQAAARPHTGSVHRVRSLLALFSLAAVGCTAIVGAELNDKGSPPGSTDASDASSASDAPSTSDATDGGTASDGSGGFGGSDATVEDEAGALMNLVLPANGGKIESFTSEYCNLTSFDGDCQPGYWNHTNINDGKYAYGRSPAAFSASWASALKMDATPEAFVFSFKGGASARIVRLVLQNYGEEGGMNTYYATHFRLLGKAEGATTWDLILDLPLKTNEVPQEFDLVALTGSPLEAARIRFVITGSVGVKYWDFGEFEAWGYLL